MQKWEYKVTLEDDDSAKTEKYVNSLGNEGWELVAVSRLSVKDMLYFKRPKVSAEAESFRSLQERIDHE